MIYIGIDDTDNLNSRGTGRLARNIAAALSSEFTVLGVVRHQLLQDPRVPFTSHNSSATILLEDEGRADAGKLFARVREMLLSDFQEGSDPGLCVTREVPPAVTGHGRRAQKTIVTQGEARALAREYGIPLEGLGGTEDGVIGALASVGLTACGEDGRYLLVGGVRDLSGIQPVSAVLAAGVREVRTMDGGIVMDGMILADKIRPARRGGEPVAYVEWRGDRWEPLKLN